MRQDPDDSDQFQSQQDQFMVYNYNQRIQSKDLPSPHGKASSPLDKPLQLQLGSIIKQVTSKPNKQVLSHSAMGNPYQSIYSKQSRRKAEQAPQYEFLNNFQSANLEAVTTDTTSSNGNNNLFFIKLKFDTNSSKQSQWFYFGCRGIQKKVTFIVGPFQKPDSLYNHGMQVCVRSEHGQWSRGGSNIKYAKCQELLKGYHPRQASLEQMQESACILQDKYYLRFEYNFKHSNKTTYFAYSYPYTYTDLEQYISQKEKKQLDYLTVTSVGKSYQGRDMHCLSIGNPLSKQVIFLTARVHPGQSVSSFILKGFLDALLGSSHFAESLRSRFYFKVYPMLNPDGVALGNYRLSFTGYDLNRRWKETSLKLHPEIYEIKKSILHEARIRNPLLLIDIHGHSRKRGVFFYGCGPKSKESSTSNSDSSSSKTQLHRQFPFIMSRICEDYCYEHSCFAVQESKKGTERVSMFRALKIPNIFTLESTFSGAEGKNQDYSVGDFVKIGVKLAEGMHVHLSDIGTGGLLSGNNIRKLNSEGNGQAKEAIAKKHAILSELYNNKKYMQVGAVDDSGSESAPSQNCFEEDLILKKLNQFETENINTGSKRQFNRKVPNSQPRSNILSEDSASVRPMTSGKYTSSSNRRSPNYHSSSHHTSKFNLINGTIFNKKNMETSVQFHKTSNLDHNARGRLYTKQEADKELTNATTPDNNARQFNTVQKARNLGSQYKRVKKYAEELVRKQRERQRSLGMSQVFNEPKILKMHQATLNVGCSGAMPSFYPKKTTIVLPLTKQQQSLSKKTGSGNSSSAAERGSMSNHYFLRSIQAKDYLQEKQKTLKITPAVGCRKLVPRRESNC